MALYKEEKVNPMWSCGFMLIQMPILLVLYHVILEIPTRIIRWQRLLKCKFDQTFAW